MLKKILFILSLTGNVVFSQTDSLLVWPREIPYSIKNSEVNETANYVPDGITRLRNVVNPSLYVYSPQKEKSNIFQMKNRLQARHHLYSWFMQRMTKLFRLRTVINFYLSLKNNDIPIEMHIFEKGGHGFGLAEEHNGTEYSWPEQCLKWLKGRGLL